MNTNAGKAVSSVRFGKLKIRNSSRLLPVLPDPAYRQAGSRPEFDFLLVPLV